MRCLCLLLALLMAPAVATPRVVALDWASGETALALGVVPVGFAQIPDYRIWSGGMPMPAAVVDVGLRMEPNLELIHSLQPDLILIAPLQVTLMPQLSRIAPVVVVTFNDADQPDGYRQAKLATRELAHRLGRSVQAETLIAQSDAALASLGRQLHDAPPVYLLRFTDRRHAWVLGRQSLLGGALAAAGIPLAMQAQTNAWGFSNLPLTDLAQVPEAQILYIDPLPFAELSVLDDNQLWRQLPAVQAGRVLGLPPVWLGNGLPSVLRFSQLLAERWPNPQEAG